MEHPIRFAAPDDLAPIQRIVRDAYTPYVARIGREPGPMRDDYAQLIAEGHVHVAERDGIVQGILVLLPQDGAMLLDNIAVRPEAQGSGLGRGMLAYAEQAAILAGYPAIKLYTNEAMFENIARYKRSGYVETHRADAGGLRRVYMRKPLIVPGRCAATRT